MRIGEVSRRSGVPPSTLRYYEQTGILVPPARNSGRRDYDLAILDQLTLIQFAKRCGFALNEIRELMGIVAGESSLGERWKRLASRKADSLLRQIAELERVVPTLRAAARCRCRDVEQCGQKIRSALAGGTSATF